ncbi:hypothetical protein K523DRAFT_260709 [Schizophyllum commune Tattone D]|nr:hypothetical protein K525DRAFT_263272 [Schizophyllum commune Loenen D]KAI5835474.1 hypothetical protein K523DRAFT_260709 [Schizophyllum commune Tattone D]
MLTPTIHNTLGMLFDSLVVSTALYGAGMLQGWYYYRRYSQKDHWAVKSVIGLVLLLDTLQQGMFAASVYRYCVSNLGNPAFLGVLDEVLIVQIFFVAAIALAVQLFYCYRVLMLSKKNWFVTLFLVLMATSAFATVFTYCGFAVRYEMFADLARLKSISIAVNVTSAATDVGISLAMIWYLRRARTGFKRSNDLIKRLIMFTFNTGLPTSAVAIFACIAINVWPNTFIYMFFFFLEGRLYTNSLLVTLNSRSYIRNSVPETSESFGLSTGPSRSRSQYNSSSRPAPDAITIKIDTVQHCDYQQSSEYSKESTSPVDGDSDKNVLH